MPLAPAAGPPRPRVARRALLAAGVPVALGITRPGFAADPDTKTAAAAKARLAKIAASGKKDERLEALGQLARVSTPESADWIVKVAFDRKAEEDVRLAGIAALDTIGTDPAVARHLVTIAQRDLQKPNGEYLLAAALGVEDVNATAPLRATLDTEGAKKKPVYTRCCKAAALVGQVNEAAHEAGEDPTGHSVEALKNLCRLSLFSEGPKYEQGAPTLRRAVTQGFIACHQPEAVDALFELTGHLLEKPSLDAELDVLAYFHEISGEFLGSDFAAWRQWWEGEGRQQPLHPRRVDRDDKRETKKRVVVIYELCCSSHAHKVSQVLLATIKTVIQNIHDGSEFCILESGNYDHGKPIFIDGGRATPASKLTAITKLFEADGYLDFMCSQTEGNYVSDTLGGGTSTPYHAFTHALTSLRPTEIHYIHSGYFGSGFDDYSPKNSLFREKKYFNGKRVVRLITGANRHHERGGVSISCFAVSSPPDARHDENLLARWNWGNYFHQSPER